MSTTNIELNSEYIQIVNSTDEFFLSLNFSTGGQVEIATTSANAAPSVVGHLIRGSQYQEMNRSIIGPGYVWARSKNGVPMNIVLSVWGVA